jgi:hypothetical protein
MADILSFRAKAQAASDASSGQDFLHEEDHTLSFQVTETGSLGISNILEHRADTPEAPALNDWSNQELADLYRVKRLLDTAGVPNELDRGLTDEGDPWLVFVGPDGEVFIHLCRLDALYVLDSPNIQAPLRGADFNALIEAFTNRALPRTGTAAADGPGARVVRLERGGKVYLHPSALLAALIWTLFLAAEEIVLMTPDADQMAEGLDDISTLTFGDVHLEGQETPFIVSATEPMIEGQLETGLANDPKQVAAQEAFLRDNTGTSGLTVMQNSYGMGLSTIAIAFGFMADQAMSDDKALIGDDLLAMGTDDSADTDDDTRVLAENKDVQNPDIALTETVKLAIETSADSPLTTDELAAETVMAATNAVATGQVLSTGLDLIQSKIAKAATWVDTTFKDAAPKEVVTAQAPAEDVATEEETAVATVQTQAVTPPPTSFTLSTLKTALFSVELESYALGGTSVLASFALDAEAIDALETISALPFIDQGTSIDTPGLISEDPVHTSGLRSFDQEARSFMDFILGKTEAIEMISAGNELILIDSTIFNSSDSYVVSWALDDGGVISIIGQRSEFAEFDLIA